MKDIELLSDRDKARARRELAHAMAAVHLHARDEDDFAVLWGSVSGFSDSECSLAWKALNDTEREWDVDSVVEIIIDYGETTEKIFSVNTFLSSVPPEHHHLVGLAVRRLRRRLEPAGWEVATAPSRKGGAVRQWRFSRRSR